MKRVREMRIREIKIHNFRSVHEMTATLYAFTRIVGANNAGKSNVVDALRCFYGRKFNPDCDLPFGTNANDEESFVEVSFEGNGKDFADILNVDGDMVPIRIRFYFHKPSDKSLDGKYVVVDDAGMPVENVKPLRKLPDTILGSLIYIPSMSKPTDELKLTGSSALNDLMGLAFGGQYANSAAYKEFASSVSKLTNQSKASENNDTCSLSQIEQLLSADLCQWGVKLNMEFKPLAVPDLIKSMLDIELIDDETGKVVDVSRFGSGFQRSLIFRLVKAAAEWKGSKETDGENDGFRIMLFEEPEAFLHPDQQYELALKLKDLSVHGMQVVCTSHSPIFVGCKSEDIPSIIRVEKKKGCTNCYQVDGDKWQSLLDANGQFPEELNVKEEENTAYLDEFRYALWMLGERASIFFAKQVLLVEGATEVALIDILRENGVLSLPTGTVVVNCWNNCKL